MVYSAYHASGIPGGGYGRSDRSAHGITSARDGLTGFLNQATATAASGGGFPFQRSDFPKIPRSSWRPTPSA